MVKSYREKARDNWRIFSLFANHAQEKAPPRKFRRKLRKRIDYWDSTWGRMLRDDNTKDPSSREGKDFRKRFRVPFPVFCKLCVISEESNLFNCGERDRWGRGGVPLELKILGILRMLGRGWCLDDISECSGISEETMRRSFHVFHTLFTRKHYLDYVMIPTGEDLMKTMRIYDTMGLTGCIGSMDGVHIIWDKCPVSLTNLCKGKEKMPTLVYNATVSHTGRIQACTKSFWGARNDKTIVKYDKHIMDLKKKYTYNDIEYELLDDEGVPQKRNGAMKTSYNFDLNYLT